MRLEVLFIISDKITTLMSDIQELGNPDPSPETDLGLVVPGPSPLIRDSEGSSSADQNQNLPSQNAEESEHTISSFLRQDDVKALSQSKYATYKEPKNNFQKIINILNVSRSKKIKDLQEGSSGCEIISTYRYWVSQNQLLARVPSELETATKKLKLELKQQTSIKDFFQRVSSPKLVSKSSDQENNNNGDQKISKPPNQLARNKSALPVRANSLFELIGMTAEDEKMIRDGSKIDQDLLLCKDVESKLRAFYSNETELNKKAAWEVKTSKMFSQKSFVKSEVATALLESLKPLVDKENNIRMAADLPVEQVAPFLMERSKQANKIAKKAFLKLRSKELLANLRSVNHAMRRRISNNDKWFNPDEEFKFTCYKIETSWEKCLDELEEKNWRPQSKNGNVSLNHFITCLELFRSLEIRGGDFITAADLLDSLKIPEKRMAALDTLVHNLPILMARRNGTILLLNVRTFLRSDSQIVDMMKIVKSLKSGEKEEEIIDITEGEVSNERKSGSGRLRIVH